MRAIRSRERNAFIFFGCFCLILMFMAYYRQDIWDNDTWFLLNSGQEILQEGFVRIEPFSVHENLGYLCQQWLSAVLFWGLYSAGGQILLIAVTYVLFAIFFLFFLLLIIKAAGGRRVLGCAITAICLIPFIPFLKINPRIFDLLVILVTVAICERYRQTGSIALLILLPVLSIVQVNLHATMWVLPVCVVACSFFDRTMSSRVRLPLIVALLAMIIVLPITPYGIDAPLYIFKSLFGSTISILGINELEPYTIKLLIAPLIIPMVLAISSGARHPHNVPARSWLLFAGFTLLGLWATREISLACIGCGLLAAHALRTSSFSYSGFARKLQQRNFDLVSGGMIFSVIALVCLIGISVTTQPSLLTKQEADLAEIGATLEEDSLQPNNTNVFTQFNEGSYIGYLGYRIYIDPRAELWCESVNGTKEIVTEYMYLEHGKLSPCDFLNQYDFDYMVIKKESEFGYRIQEIKDLGFKEISQNDTYYLMKEKESRNTK